MYKTLDEEILDFFTLQQLSELEDKGKLEVIIDRFKLEFGIDMPFMDIKNAVSRILTAGIRTIEKDNSQCQKCKDKGVKVYAVDSQDFMVLQWDVNAGKMSDNGKAIARFICRTCTRG